MYQFRAPYPLKDGRTVTLDSSFSSFIFAMFVETTLGVYDSDGALPSDNLTTDPTWINGGTDWIERTVGSASDVLFAEGNTQLLPQETEGQLVVNGNFSLGSSGWTQDTDTGATIDFSGNQCTITGGNQVDRYARVSQHINTSAVGTLHTIQCDLSGATVKLRIGTTDGANDIYENVAYDGSQVSFTPSATPFHIMFESQGSSTASIIDNITVAQTAVGEAGIAQSVATANTGEEHTVRIGTTGGQEYRIRVGTSEGDGSYIDQHSSSSSLALTFTPAVSPFFITVDAYGDTTEMVVMTSIYAWYTTLNDKVSFVTPYLDSELRELYFVPLPKEQRVYVLHPKHPTYKLRRLAGVYDFSEVVFTDPPAEWVAGNYPSCGAYFQGRLWLGGTPDQPQTFWASQSNTPQNFNQGTQLDNEALEFTLAKFGRLEWMSGTKNLLLGTVNGEHLVTSDGGVITPKDIQVQQQSSYGSKSLQPLAIGDQVFYVSPDGRKLRAIQYEWDANNWLSKDLTFFSEHITETGIRSIAWAQHPDQLLWCALEDGTAACLTYERGENIYGWHKHETQGYFREFAVGESYGTSQLIALVQRDDGDLSLETYEKDKYFDAYGETTTSDPSGVSQYFLGFSHLAGKQVQVILDGAMHPDVIVDTAGGITTEWAGRTCIAGLQFTPELKTLPFDKKAETGSAQVYKKRYNKLLVTFLNSAKPVVNGERVPVRHPATPMNEREPNELGLYRTETVTLGWDRDAYVTISQDLPLACTVMSIAGEMNENKL